MPHCSPEYAVSNAWWSARDHVLDMDFIRDGPGATASSSAVHLPDTFHDTVEFFLPAPGDDDVRPFIRQTFAMVFADSALPPW